MKTQSALELFQYWNRLRNGEGAPSRTQIEPSDIRNVLSHTFILEANGSGDDFTFRIAGTNISNLFVRQLRGTLLRTLFQNKHRPMISRLIRNCHQDAAVVLLALDGTTRTGRSTIIEIILLPLKDEKEGPRILGCLAPHQYQFWHGLEGVDQIDLHSIRVIDPDREPLFLTNRPEIELPPKLAPHESQMQINGIPLAKPKLQLSVIQGGKTALSPAAQTKR